MHDSQLAMSSPGRVYRTIAFDAECELELEQGLVAMQSNRTGATLCRRLVTTMDHRGASRTAESGDQRPNLLL
jgi:hypothetical protein